VVIGLLLGEQLSYGKLAGIVLVVIGGIGQPFTKWLGLCSPKDKIRTSGLWLVNELYKEPLSIEDLELLRSACSWAPAAVDQGARDLKGPC
jgi:hypothetical protein